MSNDYEKRWREAMADFAPAAGDADWAAMQELLAPGRTTGKWWPSLGGGALLLLAVLLGYSFPRGADPVLIAFPITLTDIQPKGAPADQPDRRRTALEVLSAMEKDTWRVPDTLTNQLSNRTRTSLKDGPPGYPEPLPADARSIRSLPWIAPPLPVAAIRPLPTAYPPYDVLLRRLPPIRSGKPSRSYYPTPLFDHQ